METLARAANRGSISTGGYDIDNSYKNESDNTERMYRAWGGITANTKTWTVSLWVKRTELGSLQYIWGAGTGGADFLGVGFLADDTLRFRQYVSADHCVYVTNRVFRDTSAWYHIVAAVDTTNGTAGDRLRIYINGVEETSFSTETNYSADRVTNHNANGGYMEVGAMIGSARFNGYIAEVNSITGTQYAPTAFGEFDAASGIWIPIQFAGSYAENSVFLEFKDSSSLGTDTSGNGQTFTLQNLSAADQATDTPTNNFQTFLSDGSLFNTGANNITYSEGGTKFAKGNATAWTISYSNMAMPNGKWYMEFENHGTGKNTQYGLIPVAFPTTRAALNLSMGETTDGTVAYNLASGGFNQNGGGSGGVSSSTGDIIGIAVDKENNKAYWHKNGTYMNGANPVTGSSGTSGHYTLSDEPYFFAVATYNPNNSGKTNTGGYTAISISSAASDANGYGTFEYAPPTGYYALCTKNLAEYG